MQRRQFDDFFAGRLGTSAYTVVVAHGADTDEGRAFRFVPVDNPGGEPKAVEGWEPVMVELTARTIADVVTEGAGVLVTSSVGAATARSPTRPCMPATTPTSARLSPTTPRMQAWCS